MNWVPLPNWWSGLVQREQKGFHDLRLPEERTQWMGSESFQEPQSDFHASSTQSKQWLSILIVGSGCYMLLLQQSAR